MAVYEQNTGGVFTRAARLYDVNSANTYSQCGVAYDVNSANSYSLVFPPLATISSVSPTTGNSNGGYTVNVYGSGFINATYVNISGYGNVGLTFVSDTNIRFTMPATSAATRQIRVINRAGTSTSYANFVVFLASVSLANLTTLGFHNNKNYTQPVNSMGTNTVNASGFNTLKGTAKAVVQQIIGNGFGTEAWITMYVQFADGSRTQVASGNTIVVAQGHISTIVNNAFSISIAGKTNAQKASIKLYVSSSIFAHGGGEGQVYFYTLQLTSLVASQ